MIKIVLIVLGVSSVLSWALPNPNHISGLDLTKYQLGADNIPIVSYDANNFNPDVTNQYHLFTRSNPLISQPLVIGHNNILSQSNFNNNRRTVFLIHGWLNSATSDFNRELVPVLLSVEDLNVIVVDWSIGANSLNYRIVNTNAVKSGEAVARFIGWLSQQSGISLEQVHLIGHGLGGHQAGVTGRASFGKIGYITGLNPSLIGWVTNIDRLSPNDALYTEVLHTNYVHGYIGDLGHVDFYFNGGISMPGCDSNECDHDRSFLYFAESIVSGGFTGRECLNYYAAVLGMCDFHPRRLQMGGLNPKYGKTGVYYLETNPSSPYSQG
ncbi:pancreatic triacylglycerol lipase-like [Pieris brassicae]|uniref:pancreatic triacylglycerol lipase-like n=1 Tax=Pieris brassicae TaxID=7116 RepID=UPI001E65F7D9|nr:pancreatic triacylglycerol lipase-like [Pieris brassicae]